MKINYFEMKNEKTVCWLQISVQIDGLKWEDKLFSHEKYRITLYIFQTMTSF